MKIFNLGILFGYNTKLSGLDNKEVYGHQLGELPFRSWERRGYEVIGSNPLMGFYFVPRL